MPEEEFKKCREDGLEGERTSLQGPPQISVGPNRIEIGPFFELLLSAALMLAERDFRVVPGATGRLLSYLLFSKPSISPSTLSIDCIMVCICFLMFSRCCIFILFCMTDLSDIMLWT